MRTLYTLLLFLITANGGHCQQFNYVNYNVKDGLAGITVYDIRQDKDGFIWFATDNGLSRFDGANFKNFTVRDGLPDNEVLCLFLDSKQRMWIGTNSNEVAYFRDGLIHNQHNDSALGQIHLKRSGHISYNEDPGPQEVIIDDSHDIVVLNTDGHIVPISNQSLLRQGGIIGSFHDTNGATMIMQLLNGVYFLYSYHDRLLTFQRTLKGNFSSQEYSIFPYGPAYKSPAPMVRSSYFPGKTISRYVNTIDGSWQVDTVSKGLGTHYLEGKKVSTTFDDEEGNLWFATLGEGIFKLPSTYISNVVISSVHGNKNKAVISITPYNNELICGLNYGEAFMLDRRTRTGFIRNLNTIMFSSGTNNRVFCGLQLSNGVLLLGLDALGIRLEKNGLKKNWLLRQPIKSITEIDSGNVLIGTGYAAYKMSTRSWSITDTIWRDRSLTTFYQSPYYYIGTPVGLYRIDQQKNSVFLGNLHYSLSRRINDIKASADHTLWFATNDEGITGYRDGKIVARITDTNGLSSNICKTLFVKNQYLWAGTTRGLNKIDISDLRMPIVKINTADGLLSDISNALFVDDSTVYVATPDGLTYFNEQKIAQTSICRLKVLDIRNDNHSLPLRPEYSFSYRQNSFYIEFTAISIKSAGDIVYHYRLEGLDNEWKETHENKLDYQTLPSGKYVLSLYAVNKFGVKSDTRTISIRISTPFWRSLWFYIAIVLLVVILTVLIVNRENRKEQHKLIEKSRIEKQFSALEQQALLAQMNPHFIFNCLNSIQQFIVLNNKEKANKYLTGFASLIRQTLDISNRQTLSLEEEINYLTGYLEMEKLRFGDSFNYEIITEPNIDLSLQIPALLLQPFVENSLRHGLRYVENGLVVVQFTRENETLICTVTDNGIGREKAAVYKSSQHIEYQSKGTNLTVKRIELLNHIFDKKIQVEIVDLTAAGGEPLGTKVILQIPV